MIDYPKTLLEILKNIKTVANEGQLLHDSDYTDENILRIFGSQSVEWVFNETGRHQGNALGFESIIEKTIFPNGLSADSISVFFRFTKQGEVVNRRITVSLHEKARVTFSQILEIFGSTWKVDEKAILNRVHQPNRIFRAPTHELGNTPIVFEINQEAREDSIFMELAEDGSLFMLDLRSVEEQR